MQVRGRLTLLTAAVVAVWLASVSGPATAGEDPRPPNAARASVVVVETLDDLGDVHITHRDGLSLRDRRTIDIHRVRVTDLGAKVRFEIQWRDVRRLRRYVDQMAFIEMRPAGDSSGHWSAQAGLSPQMPQYGFAYWYADASGTRYRSCDPIRSRTRQALATVSIDVPNRCLPTEPAKISVRTYTGSFRGDSTPYSWDWAPVPGLHTLR